MQYTIKCQARNRAECKSDKCPDKHLPAFVREFVAERTVIARPNLGGSTRVTAADLREMFEEALEMERDMQADREAFEAYYNNGDIDWDQIPGDAF